MTRQRTATVQGRGAMDQLLDRLCRHPNMLAAYRRDPARVARRGGVQLSSEAVQAMRQLEENAVTDVVLDADAGGQP